MTKTIANFSSRIEMISKNQLWMFYNTHKWWATTFRYIVRANSKQKTGKQQPKTESVINEQ